MKSLLYLAAILFLNPLQAAEVHPSWAEFDGLLGVSIEDQAMLRFTKQYALIKSGQGDSGSFTPYNPSYSVQFKHNRVECIVLHVGSGPKGYGESNWTGYTEELPFGLKRLFARRDVITLLGESDTSSGNFWQAQGHEVRITFSKGTGLIQEIYVWKKSKVAPNK